MKLWLLKPVGYDVEKGWDYKSYPRAWNHDCQFGVVVRAETEGAARDLAHAHSGDETGWNKSGPLVWHDPEVTTCEEISMDGAPGLVLRDFNERD